MIQKPRIPGRVFKRNDITTERMVVLPCPLCQCLHSQAVELTRVSVVTNVTGLRFTWETNLGLSGRLYEDEVNQAGRSLTSHTLNMSSTAPRAGRGQEQNQKEKVNWQNIPCSLLLTAHVV